MDSTKSAFEALRLNQKTYTARLHKSSKRVTRKVKKHHHYVAQAVILSVLAVFVLASNYSPSQSASNRSNFGGLVSNTTIDEVATAQVAKQIAQGTNLLIADNVSNLADTLEARVEFAASTDSYLAKPQIVSTDARTRQDIVTYVVKDGDSVTLLARQFGVTSDSIRWANDLASGSNVLEVGDELEIPPVSGLIYTVRQGDTPTSLAKRYNADANQIVSFNDAELAGLEVGTKIIIPNGEEPEPATPTYFSSGSVFAFGTTPLYGGNGYSYGYCTWHVANRRAAIGRPIPRNLGNAVTWASVAAASGLTVTEEPVTGAVLWHKNSSYIAGGYGHVAFVESIDAKGNARVSDMNYTGGWNAISYRTVTKAEFSQYLFIH